MTDPDDLSWEELSAAARRLSRLVLRTYALADVVTELMEIQKAILGEDDKHKIAEQIDALVGRLDRRMEEIKYEEEGR